MTNMSDSYSLGVLSMNYRVISYMLIFILFVITVVLNILEAFYPEARIFEKCKPIIFIATLAVFPAVLDFLLLLIGHPIFPI